MKTTLSNKVKSEMNTKTMVFKKALQNVIETSVAKGIYKTETEAREHLRTFEPYEIVCSCLGFNSRINFVTVSRGRIGFSCGKPDEIRNLRAACQNHGFPMTKGLSDCHLLH